MATSIPFSRRSWPRDRISPRLRDARERIAAQAGAAAQSRPGGAMPDACASQPAPAIDDLETGLVVVIPFVAAAMARGLWLY